MQKEKILSFLNNTKPGPDNDYYYFDNLIDEEVLYEDYFEGLRQNIIQSPLMKDYFQSQKFATKTSLVLFFNYYDHFLEKTPKELISLFETSFLNKIDLLQTFDYANINLYSFSKNVQDLVLKTLEKLPEDNIYSNQYRHVS